MNVFDDLGVWLAAGVLRSGDYEIEAVTLEAIAEDAAGVKLDDALVQASRSGRQGGAFGLEIAGGVVIPVLVAAAAQFWAAYQKKIMEALGARAADATVEHIKRWFANAPPADKQEMAERLAAEIRRIGAERGLAAQDIEALAAAATPARLAPALAA